MGGSFHHACSIVNTVFPARGMADKMQFAKKATLIAALACIGCPPSTMIHNAWAVEVSGKTTSENHPIDDRDASVIQRDPFVLGSRTFTIPYTVDADGSEPIEIQLFVSRGATDSWQLIESKKASGTVATPFKFTADQDGEFWFATRTTHKTSMTQLASTVLPQLKVFVDTSKPYCEIVAEADADGRVDVQLVIQDATPLKSMQMRYFTDTTKAWHDLDVSALPTDGRLSFRPDTDWQQLSLQLVVVDSAGNQNIATKLVQLPRIAEAPPENRYAMLPGDHFNGLQIPFRLSESDAIDAKVASGPVIALDRHRRTNDLSGNQATANGYAPVADPTGQRGIGNFRGAAFPTSPINAFPQTPSSPNPLPNHFGAVPMMATPELVPRPEPTTMPEPNRLPSPIGMSEPISMNDQPFALPPTAKPAPIDAPSIYATPAPQTPDSALPPPASLEQITNGLGLTPPGNNSGPETIATPDATADPLAFGEPVPKPEIVPTPIPQRTLSEAMRPLTEKSALPPRSVQAPTPKPELAPSPRSDYRSARPNAPEPASLASRVPVRYSDGLRFSLAYELEAVGSQGVEAIELYGSVDEGRTWKLWGSDPDRVSPFDIETREEGVFGYRIVVVGNNGLASPRPLSGEMPDIVVVVDTQAPEVRITGARYGEGDRIGALVILYECSDPNIMARPVALSFGPNADGPWTTIAAGLNNDGDYVWPADPQLPRQFYLRMDATDQAGNVGTYILDKPIDAQGLAPRARIRGFQSISGIEPDATFK